MPHFYFHLVTPEATVVDEDGRELPDLERAREEALAIARSLIARRGLCYGRGASSRVVIENESSRFILTIDCGILKAPPVMQKQLDR